MITGKEIKQVKYKYLFFDLDGTLSNTLEGVTNAAVYTFEKLGEPLSDKSVVRSFIGPPLQYSFEVLCGYPKGKADAAIEYFREYYEKSGWRECELFDGIKALLRELKAVGYKLAVATSKSEVFARPLLDMLGVGEFFDFVAGSDDSIGRSSKSDVIVYALDALSISAQDALMIGDTKFDIEGANQTGLDSVGVLFGFGSRESLEREGATYITETVSDLREFLISL